MGVQGLWELVAPVGRRVSVETLAGKKLAIDASIWMVQFMKAMRDEKGEMVRNAHLIGFFRRICKLLFLRTKPVFIFDGGTPSLKRRTVIARRRQRENAQTKLRKTAEKLLLNNLKAMRLKELAENLENQRKENDLKRKNAVPEVAKNTDNQKEKHDLKGISVVTENNEVMDNISNSKEPKGKNVVPELVKDVEKNDLKGKSVMIDDIEVSDSSSKSSDNATRRFDQEALDAMLAASLAEEEDEGVIGNSTASVRDVIFSEEEEDDYGDEEMVLPVMDGKVDPAVLAALPPSMQLDLLVQMRERLMAENRQKYQKVKKAPAEFSELQIQSYLKTVAFRREINEVQKSASGKDMGGVQTSRIASEANREYIFSSSFTGDKQTLASAGAEKIGNVEHRTSGKRPAFFDSINHVSSVSLPSSALESAANEPISNLNDVETYVDERGRLRVSRVRAMGIRMTRDLQRNLDLMKEKENDSPEQREAIFNKIVLGEPGTFSLNNHHLEASTEGHGVISSFSDEVQRECPQVVPNRTPMNISFLEDEIVSRSTDEDDLFAHLVAGGSVSSVNNDLQSKHPFDTASDCSWEEGIIDEKTVNFSNDVGNCQMSIEKENINDDTEVDWEEGICDATENGLVSPVAHNKASPRVSLEEEADMDEAIRRSLNDCTRDMSMFTSFEKENFEVSRETAKQNTLVRDLTIEEEEDDLVHLPRENDTLPSQVSYEAVAGSQKLDHMVVKDKPQTFNIVERQFALSGEIDTKYDENGKLLHKPCEEKVVSKYATSKCGRDTPGSDPVSPLELKGGHLIAVPSLNTSVGGGEEFSFVGSNCSSKIGSHVPAAVRGDTTEVNLVDARQNDFEATPTCHSYETTEIAKSLEEPFTKELASSAHTKQNLVAEKNLVVLENQTSITKEASTNQINMEDPIEVSEASLDEEMLLLRQERLDLGDEQRKLERNAESVSGEMFAECQELLQMFGLPYIIAPMEAEAQCAFLELAKLVDGVVTDDSDVFLFGARSVYKNIFDDRKYVETYFMKDIESELGLTREQLIRMALLLGSDYTEGVSGIGIVNAIEVVHAFPEEDGLVKFREWLESPDPSILGKLDTQSGSGSRKKVSNVRNSDADCLKGVDGGFAGGGNVSEGHDNEHSIDNLQKTKQVFMDNHRNVSKNWHIPSSFPSEAVVSAYVSPQVDQSTESFSWGKPDLAVLRKLCWEKFGWTNQKADDLLLPVLKEYNKHETQLRLEAFYTFNERFAKIRSRRIKKAVKGITGKRSSEVMDDVPTEASRKRTTPRHSKRKEKSNVEQDSIVENECSISEKPTPKQSRRRKMETTPLSDEVGEPSTQKKERCSTKKGSSGAARGRGKGRGRGRGRGKGKEAPGYESTETISSNRSNSSDELEKQDGKIERPYEVRKSTRPRNNANYMENDSETPGLSKYVDQINIDDDIDGAVEREPVCDAGANGGEPVPEDGDYLEMGGGFCLDEDKQENDPDQFVSTSTRRLSDREKSNLPLEGRFSEDYLAMGGGFCEDESELHNETVQPISSPVRNLEEVTTGTRIDPLPTTLDPPNCIDVHDTIKAGELQEDRLPEADSITSNSGLTAIPFLKRKRRKM